MLGGWHSGGVLVESTSKGTLQTIQIDTNNMIFLACIHMFVFAKSIYSSVSCIAVVYRKHFGGRDIRKIFPRLQRRWSDLATASARTPPPRLRTVIHDIECPRLPSPSPPPVIRRRPWMT